MRVDVHAHYLPPALFDVLEELDALRRMESYSLFRPLLRPSVERMYASGPAPVIDDWISQMDGSGLDAMIIGVGALQPYFDGARAGAKAARAANLLQREAAELGRGRIYAFATLPLPHVDATLEEVRFALDECGCVGVTVGTSVCGQPLDSAVFEDLWAMLDERQATVFIHPATQPDTVTGSGDFQLAPIFVSPAEVAVALCRLIVTKLTARYPRVQIISVAMGGTLPVFANRFDAALERAQPDLFAELGGLLPRLRAMWFDTSLMDEPHAFDAVRRTFGIDRLIFGSDLPRAPLTEVVAAVRDSELLDDTEKSAIFEAQGPLAARLASKN